MADYVLILNAGSSSLKFTVYRPPTLEGWRIESRGRIEGIGTSARLVAQHGSGGESVDVAVEARDGRQVVEVLAEWLRSQFAGSRVLAVGHRVVHGGVRFSGPILLSPESLAELRDLTPLAPLHQPYNLAAIECAELRLPGVPQVACFDTAFHRGRPAVSDLVPLPAEIRRFGVQRYGFHGLSYEYIASALPKIAPRIAGGRVIVAHLGSGASLCAIREGKSIDCTFGFTPLDGLCMGTRPGTLDPGVVLHLIQGLKLSAAEVEAILYKQSGLLGISGISNDMRRLSERSEPEADLAVEYFVYRAAKEIGALTAVLGGLDALVFTAGIGENSPEIRRRICEASAWLGVALDTEANAAGRPLITLAESRVEAWIVPTNEEEMIARHTAALLGLNESA